MGKHGGQPDDDATQTPADSDGGKGRGHGGGGTDTVPGNSDDGAKPAPAKP